MRKTNYRIEDIHVSEKDKNEFGYLKDMMDHIISELVIEKKHIKQCRNLYEGVRDAQEYEYLEKTFGIETPLALKMTPIVKTRVDVLLGILLDETFTYHVTANDAVTLDKINKERIAEKVKRVKAKFAEQINAVQKDISQGKQQQPDLVTEKFIKANDKLVNEGFISSFEIAAQSLIRFFSQDSTIDLKQKVKQYFFDLLVTGEGYYRVSTPQIGADPILTICKPENVFMNKNTNHQFISTGNKPNVTRVVHREMLRREEVLNQYGHYLNEEDIAGLFGDEPTIGSGNYAVRSGRDLEFNVTSRNRSSHSQYTEGGTDFVPVYYVEWLANNEVKLNDEQRDDMQTVDDIKTSKELNELYGKDAGSGAPKVKGYRLDKYEGVRIGSHIYINCGRSKRSSRSIGNPWQTKLSINGGGYNERNGKAYSVAYSLKNLQDSYDIITFFRDNLVANSGIDGSRINLAAIPKVLGSNFMERLMKFMALRKQGVELIDPTEDGANLFSGYGDFKASVDGNVVAALNSILETVEAQADIISGVNRHMYSAAEQRDAVSNVKVGQQVTSLVTKDLFELVHTARQYVLLDLVNAARYVYIKGKRGTYIVGNRSVVFDIQAKNFCFTDYNIQIVNSSKENLKIEKLSAVVPELVASGVIDSDVIVKMIMSDSTTEIVNLITTSMNDKKAENDEFNQLSSQLEEASTQNKEMEKMITELQAKIDALVKTDQEIKAREVAVREKLAESKVEIESGELDRKIKKDANEDEKDKAIVQLEREQLYAENVQGNAKEIRNNI